LPQTRRSWLHAAKIAAHNWQRLSWPSIALPLHLIEELAEVAAPPVSRPGSASLLALPPQHVARLVGMLWTAGHMAQSLPAQLHAPNRAAGVVMTLREEVAAAVTAEAAVRPCPRAVGQAIRIVKAAEDFMEARRRSRARCSAPPPGDCTTCSVRRWG
jgi:hypothetical protein